MVMVIDSVVSDILSSVSWPCGTFAAVALLSLTPDELLSTTRAVRRRLDLTRPVEARGLGTVITE
jgi:hypothetical protein